MSIRKLIARKYLQVVINKYDELNTTTNKNIPGHISTLFAVFEVAKNIFSFVIIMIDFNWYLLESLFKKKKIIDIITIYFFIKFWLNFT